MNHKLSCLNFRELQALYIQQGKEFLQALEQGQSWQSLEDKRLYIREIGRYLDQSRPANLQMPLSTSAAARIPN